MTKDNQTHIYLFINMIYRQKMTLNQEERLLFYTKHFFPKEKQL